MRYILLILCFLLFAIKADAQKLPNAYPLSEHMDATEKLYVQHQITLLEVCNYQLDSTYHSWMGMLIALEQASKSIGFDINGVQMLVSFFWNKDGSIRHIAFSRLAQSRNVPEAELQALLIQFAKQYKLPQSYDKNFFHEGVVKFPLRPQRYQPGKKE